MNKEQSPQEKTFYGISCPATWHFYDDFLVQKPQHGECVGWSLREGYLYWSVSEQGKAEIVARKEEPHALY